MDMKGVQITGFVDNKKMTILSEKSGVKDMAFIASTYDRNLFDNIRVEPFSYE